MLNFRWKILSRSLSPNILPNKRKRDKGLEVLSSATFKNPLSVDQFCHTVSITFFLVNTIIHDDPRRSPSVKSRL